MKKKHVFLLGGLAALVVVGALVGRALAGTRPLKALAAGDVAAAQVELYPPDAKIVLTEEDIERLIPILNSIVVYQEDNSYTEYDGQAVVFTLTNTDGTQTVIQAYNPFVIIDGVGYRTKYEPCEALNQFGNDLYRLW